MNVRNAERCGDQVVLLKPVDIGLRIPSWIPPGKEHRVIRTRHQNLSTAHCEFFAHVVQMVACFGKVSFEIPKKGFTRPNRCVLSL